MGRTAVAIPCFPKRRVAVSLSAGKMRIQSSFLRSWTANLSSAVLLDFGVEHYAGLERFSNFVATIKSSCGILSGNCVKFKHFASTLTWALLSLYCDRLATHFLSCSLLSFTFGVKSCCNFSNFCWCHHFIVSNPNQQLRITPFNITSDNMSSIGRMQKFCKKNVTREPATSKNRCRSEKMTQTPWTETRGHTILVMYNMIHF